MTAGTSSISYMWPQVFFLKGNLFSGFSVQVIPAKDIPHTLAELITPQGETSTACRGTSPGTHCWFCWFSTPTMMLPAPALHQLHGNYWIYRFPSLPSASFGVNPALLVHLLLSQRPPAFQRGSFTLPARVTHTLQSHMFIGIIVITKSQANFGISHSFVPTSSAHKLLFSVWMDH